MRKLIMLFCGLVLCMSFFGCGNKSDKESILKIEKNGQITGILVEDFDKSYYDVDELEEMIRLEISEYNINAGEEKVSLVSIEMADDKVKVKMQYDNYADYAAFNEISFYTGTVEDAVNRGINLNHVMLEAGGDNTISPEQIREFSGYHLVMWQGNMPVEVPEKILYHTEELTLLSSKKIISEPDLAGPFYLLYK